MANQYFQFKQFTIQQDHCAMKVSTDACIQGAWTPASDIVKDVLDIGTGTGLLSLMLAQRASGINIDAIELDANAAEQAEENIASSPWKNRVQVLQGDVTNYAFTKQYDMVICNPPFFNNSLLGDTDNRNIARHTLSLSYTDLLNVLDNVLKQDGYASILLPVAEHAEWEKLLAKNGWHIGHRLIIQPKESSAPNRVVSLCSRNKAEEIKEEKLVIYAGQNEYTPEATKLLKSFYLKL
jgi:tRNA1Val (adenine37-N6)-methyltransferase